MNTATPLYVYENRNKIQQGRWRDIYLYKDRIVGTGFCLKIHDGSIVWENDDKNDDSVKIVGIYKDIIIATGYDVPYMGQSDAGIYRISLSEGVLLPDEITHQKGLWGIFGTFNGNYPIEIREQFALMSDRKVVDVLSGKYSDVDFSKLPIDDKYIERNIVNVFINNIENKPHRPIYNYKDTYVTITWKSADGDKTVGSTHVQLTDPGEYGYRIWSVYDPSGSPAVYRTGDGKTVAYTCDPETGIIQETAFELKVNLSDPQIRISNEYIVIYGQNFTSTEYSVQRSPFYVYVFRKASQR